MSAELSKADFSAALETYLLESRELLEQMEAALLTMESGIPTPELVNEVFRAAHTIKGSGGLFGLDDVVHFTHDAETTLDAVRNGQLVMDAPMITLFLECRDYIGALVEAAVTDQVSAELLAAGEGLRTQLRGRLNQSEAEAEISRNEAWHISFRCGPDLLRDGMDPLALLRYLGTLGNLVSVVTLTDKLPALAQMNPEHCYLGFEIDLNTQQGKEEIEDAFVFVHSTSEIRILPPKSKPEEWGELIRSMPDDGAKLGEILVRSGALTRAELTKALSLQVTMKDSRPLGEILVEQGTHQEVVAAALEKQGTKVRTEQYVRVEASKLDRLVDLVGELVISSTVSSLRAEGNGDQALIEAVKTSNRFIEEVRDAALSLRMVQIGATFNRFQRVVRDLSRDLGKQVELVITGAETELDKTVVDRIGDPLTHLVRNSLDHGIETAQERVGKSKPATGRLMLNAYHESGSIVIEVGDDGRGLNRERILGKALERGLLTTAEGLTDQEVFRLIFEPGFSTADQVSNVSGRGVGMDVVKQTIEDLRGTVEIDSVPDQGSTIRLRLPLTLAIIDGFLVAAGSSRFVIPLELVEECVELPSLSRRDHIDLRGEVLPFIRLRELFQATDAPPDRQIVVVVGYGGRKAGLVVDHLLGELQTVIKPLGDVFAPLKWVSGCTVLDIGEVGLILDVPALVTKAERKDAHTTARRSAYLN